MLDLINIFIGAGPPIYFLYRYTFIPWLENKKARDRRRLYIQGYDYAAGAIVRGDQCPMELQYEYDTPFPGDRNNFDRGMEDAVDFLVKIGFVKDNRL